MKRILFVCTANICRSPMAAGIMRNYIRSKNPDLPWLVESAGTWGENGLPATPNSVSVMQTRGINLRYHKSRIISESMIRDADLILTMEAGHKEALQIEFPEKKGQIFLLSEMDGQEFDIDDPMGQSLDQFERTAHEIEMAILAGLPQIKKLLILA